LLAQRRLRHAQPLGGAAEVALFGDGHEIPEMAQQPEIYHGSNTNLKSSLDIFWISPRAPANWARSDELFVVYDVFDIETRGKSE